MFTECPVDVLIEICSHLDLADVISFISVCSSCRKLVDSKYLWTTFLNRTQKRRPLACPVGTDLSQISVDQLYHIVRLTHRVEQRLGQDRPRVFGNIKRVSHTSFSKTPIIGAVVILAVIPATSLVVLCLPDQRFVLYDTEGNVPASSISFGATIQYRAHFNEAGRHLVAVTAGTYSVSLRVLAIDYGTGISPVIRQIFSMPLDMPSTGEGLFIYKDVVGFIAARGFRRSIQAINYASNLSVNISVLPRDLTTQIRACLIALIEDTLFITTIGAGIHRVYRCPASILPCGKHSKGDGASINAEGSVVCIAEIHGTTLAGHGLYKWETQELKLSSRGFHVIRFLSPNHYLMNQSNQFSSHTEACFWPADNMQPSSPPLRLDRPVTRAAIEGKILPYSDDYSMSLLIASSPSGLYYVIVTETDSEEEFDDESDELEDALESQPVFSLHLLQYDLDPPMVRARQLEVPPDVDLGEARGLAIDERLGVIYLTYAMGRLLVIPYA